MTVLVKHSKVSTIPDADDTSLVRPSDWNADHVVVGAAASGANSDITSMTGVTGGISTPDFIQYDTTATPTIALGKERWNVDTGTLAFGIIDGTTEVNIGQQMYALVHNAEAVTITKGQAVYLFQATGNKASVKLAYNTGDATSAKTFGLAAQDIAAGGNGFITTVGVLDKLNTGAYNEGDTLYLGATAGSLTATKPAAPNHLVYIGVVERANNGNGQIYVRVQNGYELDEIHDVQIVSPTTGQTLVYNQSTDLWNNSNAPTIIGGSINNTPIGASTATTGRFSDLTDTGLTSGRVVYASTGGNLVDSANLTFDGTTLTANTLASTRINPRVTTTASSATPTINTDTTDIFGLTAQTVDITSFTTNLSGTPVNGQRLWIYIVGTAARAITWGASFEASTVPLPTTTVSTNRLDVGFVWNAATSKWRCVATAQEITWLIVLLQMPMASQ